MATTIVYVATGTDDGAYTASSLTTNRTTENWDNGNQFWRFQNVAVPQPARRVIVSATLSLTTSRTTNETAITTVTAQPGASAAISSGFDATVRPRTAASASHIWDAATAGTKSAPVTEPVREALQARSWTPGSALSLFAVRGSHTGSGAPFTFYTRDHTTVSAAAKPQLTIVWQPAGSSTGSAKITGVLTGARNAEGDTSGTATITGTRQGRKTGRASRTGSVALTGAASGRATRRGSSARLLAVPVSTLSWRSTRRGTGPAGVLAAVAKILARARRTARVTGQLSPPTGGTLAGRAGRTTRLAGSAGLTGAFSVSTLRAGTAARGSTALAGLRRGTSRREGLISGSAVFLGKRAGVPARKGVVAGTLVVAGGVRGRRGSTGSVGGAARLTGSAAGRARRRARVDGLVEFAGGTAGFSERFADIAYRVPLRSSYAQSTHTTRAGHYEYTTRLFIRGHLATDEHRAGSVEGDLRIGGDAEDAITGRKGALADPSFRVRVLAGLRRGLAGRAGASTKWLPSLAVTTTGETTRTGAYSETFAPPVHTGTGLAGRSGEAHGRVSVLDDGAGTLTGQAGRGGVCVSTSGSPSGLAAGRPDRVGGYDWFTRLYTRAAHTVRVVRGSHSRGSATASGAVNGSAVRRGTTQSSPTHVDGRPTSTTHRAGGTTGTTAITGTLSQTRSDAAGVQGSVVVAGAARGVARRGGQVSGLLRFHGNLAAATARRGVRGVGRVPIQSRSVLISSRGGQGTTHGAYAATGVVQVPVDFSGGTSGAATLHGTITYSSRPPAEVRHSVTRTAPRNRPSIVTAPPTMPTTVRITTAKRGTVKRG